MKKFKIIASLLVLLFVLFELFVFSQKEESQSQKPIISVSTFSLYDIVKHIGGDSVTLSTMIPFGVDPHSFEVTPKIMAMLEKSSLALYSGAGLEPWIENIDFKAKAIDMSSYASLRELGSHELEAHKHHDEKCAHGKIDPHYWLDFENMKKSVTVISAELEKLLPENRDLYRQNRDKYIKMLDSLDENYSKSLSTCKIDSVILNHNSLGYLAHKYSFHAESLSGLSPEADPSPNDIKRILKEIKKDGVSTIFYENFVNSKVMHSISKDSNVVAEVISPLGNITADEAAANETYETLMQRNLDKLSKAMLCN